MDGSLGLDGAISGLVRGRGKLPVAGICVVAVPRSGAAAVMAVTTRACYRLIDLVPGGYKVRFEPGCGASGYATRWYKNARASSHPTVVQVTAGQSTAGIGSTLPRG